METSRWWATKGIANTCAREANSSPWTRRRSKRKRATTASGADHEHGSAGARGGVEVQATVDGRGGVPLDEIAAGYPADLSQVRRNDSRARVLLVPRAAVAQGTGRPFGAQGMEAGMGRRHPGSRPPD